MKKEQIYLIFSSLTLIGLLLILPIRDGLGWGWDAAVFRAGARALLHGENPFLAENIQQFAGGAELSTIPNYTYAPFFLILMMPFAILPSDLALRFWFVLNIILYFSSALVLLRVLGWRVRKRAFFWLMLCLFLFAPLRTLLMVGQSGVFVLFFFSLALWNLKNDHPVWAGVHLCLAFFKPHLFFVLPFFILKRQWRMLAGFSLASFVLYAPFISLMDDWFSTILATYNSNLSHGCLPLSSWVMMSQCLLEGGLIGQTHMVLFLALFLVGTLWAIWPNKTLFSDDFVIQLGIVVTSGLMIISYVHVADQVLLVYPLLVIYRQAYIEVRPYIRYFLLGSLILAVIFPYVGDILSAFTMNQMWRLPVWYAILTVTQYLTLISMPVVALIERSQVFHKSFAFFDR